jgi:hypothetical protein
MPVIRALPAIDTAEPRISPWVIALARLAHPYLAGFIGNARIRLDDDAGDILIPAMERALSRKSRCIVAFRHQNGWEPQILLWFTLYRLAKQARKRGVRYPLPPRLLFVHGYEVFRWGGALARFMLPRFGAMPVHHAKLDNAGLNRIYRSLREGPYPLAIAPEGQVSYTLAGEPRIEPGTVRIGLTVAEQLLSHAEDAGAQASEGAGPLSGQDRPAVEIVPVLVYPEYDEKKAWRDVERLLRRVERICGIEDREHRRGRNCKGTEKNNRFLDVPDSDPAPDLSARFLRCREKILALNEERYALTTGAASPEKQDFRVRLDAVIEAALQNAAAILRVNNPAGDTINRIYIIRQICWDRIFPEDAAHRQAPLERAALDLRAGEAWYAARHMELADFSCYFRRPPGASLASAVEYAQNLYDFANRTMGGVYATRRKITPAAVRISAAAPINLTEILLTAAGAGIITREHRKAVSAEANELLKQRLTSWAANNV